MKPLILILLFPFLLHSRGTDWLHTPVGFGISIGFTNIFVNKFDRPYKLIPISFGVTFLSGVGKEGFDLYIKKTFFSIPDVLNTVRGGVYAIPFNCYFVTRNIEIENKKFKKLHPYGTIH